MGEVDCGGVALVAEDSELRIATATQARRSVAYFHTAIRDMRGGKTTIVKAEDLPLRGFDKSRGPQYLIPLYK